MVKVPLCVVGGWGREKAVRRYGQSSERDEKFVMVLNKS